MQTDSVTIVFTAAQLDYVASVLRQRPYAEVALLLQDLAAQVAQQQQQAPQNKAAPMTGPQEALNGAGTATPPPAH
jgi:hypothetical protein